ncbi:site-specific DNA-methyltransferase [Mycoplasma sp. VS1572C]
MNKDKKEIILNWLKDKEQSDSLSLEEREVFASIKELLHSKKYGLVFEEKEEDIVNFTNESILTLVQKNLIIFDKTKSLNYLIEGDNYQSLKLLLKTHRSRIDVIYIDPPYNTGNKDFMYNDQYVDFEDGFKHSKWLSFMKKRLEMAKELLSEDGAIFINIDDNEHSQLKLLCDDIFGFQNFITSIPWHNRDSIQNDTDISVNHEYILVYAKYKRTNNRRLKTTNQHIFNSLKGFVFQPKETDKSKFSNPDNDYRGIWKADPFDAPNIRPNLTYAIVNSNTGAEYYPPKGRHWRMTKDKYLEMVKDNRIIFGKTGSSKPQLKVFYDEINFKGQVNHTWFDSDVFGTSTQGKKELLNLLPDANNIFSTPKPVKLYVELMKMSIKNKNAIILDFFAGSGTTGHAVAKLNAEDGGNRTYILCTNNENNICEDVTFKRLNNIQEELPHNLIYNKVDSINKEEFINSYYSNEYLKQMNVSCYQLAQLEVGKLIDNEEIIFVTSQEEFNSFSENELLNARAIFMVENNIDIHECAGYNKIKSKIVVIPDKYYSKELTEVGYLW